MDIDMNCAYCAEGKLVDAFGIKIGELPASKVYLFKEQSHKGRCIVASKFHVSEMVELPKRRRQGSACRRRSNRNGGGPLRREEVQRRAGRVDGKFFRVRQDGL